MLMSLLDETKVKAMSLKSTLTVLFHILSEHPIKNMKKIGTSRVELLTPTVSR